MQNTMHTFKIYLIVSVILVCRMSGIQDVAGEEQVESLNSMVDALIASTVNFIEGAKYESMRIPDLEQSVQAKFLSIPLGWTMGMKAVGGVFQDLRTIERTGDATLTLDEDGKKLRIFLGLKTMEINFEHCRLWMGKLSMSQSLWVKVGRNSVDIEVLVTNDGSECKSKLEHLKINDLGDFDVKVQGLGGFDKMMADMERWVADHFKNVISSMVEEKLTEQAAKALEQYDICQFLS